MQDLGAGAGAGAASSETPSSRAPSVLPGPATQPEKRHGVLCTFVWKVLEILFFAALAAAAISVLYGIWRLIYWIAYRI